nr:hypothetical protein [uncultured Desulfobacter sp.]
MYKLCADKAANLWLNEVLQETIRLLSIECHILPVMNIILTGSLSRGEASVRKKGDGYILKGDIEFLLLSKRNTRLGILVQKCSLIKGEISKQVSRKFRSEIEVDIGVVRKNYFYNDLKPSIFTYDLTLNCISVFGPALEFKRPLFHKEMIPREDALELLLNRTIELMILKCEGDTDRVDYHYIKILLDLAGSLLAATGDYVSHYSKRPEAIRKLLSDNKGFIHFDATEKMLTLIDKAARLKMDIFFSNGTEINETEKILVEKWLTSAVLWELQHLTNYQGTDVIELCKRFETKGNVFCWFKQWVKILLYSRTATSGPSLINVLFNFFRYNPRNRIYICNLLFYLSIQLNNDVFAAKAKSLRKNFSYLPDGLISTKEVTWLWKHYIRGR